MWKRGSTRDSFLNNWNGIVSRVFANYFIDCFPSCSWSMGVLEQLGFVELEFSLLFQVSSYVVKLIVFLKLGSNATIHSFFIKFVFIFNRIQQTFCFPRFWCQLGQFAINLINGALWSTEDLNILKKLLNSSSGFSWLLVKFSSKFVDRCIAKFSGRNCL